MKWSRVGPMPSAPILPKLDTTAEQKKESRVGAPGKSSRADPVTPRSHKKRQKTAQSKEIPPIPSLIVALEKPLSHLPRISQFETDEQSLMSDSCNSGTGVYFKDTELVRSVHPLQIWNSGGILNDNVENIQKLTSQSNTTDSSIAPRGRPLQMPPKLGYHGGRITNLVSQLKNTAIFSGRKASRQIPEVTKSDESIRPNSIEVPATRTLQRGARSGPIFRQHRALSEDELIFVEAASSLVSVKPPLEE